MGPFGRLTRGQRDPADAPTRCKRRYKRRKKSQLSNAPLKKLYYFLRDSYHVVVMSGSGVYYPFGRFVSFGTEQQHADLFAALHALWFVNQYILADKAAAAAYFGSDTDFIVMLQRGVRAAQAALYAQIWTI